MTKQKFTHRKLQQLGKLFDLKLINADEPAELFTALLKYHGSEAALFKDKGDAFLTYVLKNFDLSKAQIFQYLFVLLMTNEKRGGYFVEFGATNGITLSNTYVPGKII